MAEPERQKRVLHIVEDLKMGGLERVIQTIVLGIDPRRYAAEVLVPGRAESLPRSSSAPGCL
ncbi:MAG: hypothetical protein IPI61_14735 [Syntrophaceae bacterium]|nr:hypothetical protein [Syntrophaceae bacterium]